MKDEKFLRGLTAGAVLAQWAVMYTSDLTQWRLPFSAELLSAETPGGNLTVILHSIIVLPFLLWVFSGKMENIVNGYGRLYIIRNYSRKKMLLKESRNMLMTVILFQTYTWAVFQAGAREDWEMLTAAEQIRVMSLYALALAATVMLQWLLEFAAGQTVSHMAAVLYYTASLLIYDGVRERGLLKPLFFPNLGFAMRNGALGAEGGETFAGSAACLLAVCVLLLFADLKILDKKDIM